MSQRLTDPFDPNHHLTTVQGQPYLETKYRIAWLRADAPDSHIVSELVEVSPEIAIFKTTVTRIIDGEIRGSATGYGSETPGDFRDYIEKACTKSIGRALAALGFGAQFCQEYDSAPLSQRLQTAGTPKAFDTGPSTRIMPAKPVINDAARGHLIYLRTVAQKHGLDDATLNDRAIAECGVPVEALTREGAARLIAVVRGIAKNDRPGRQPKAPIATPNGPRALEGEPAEDPTLPGLTARAGSAGNDPYTR